MGASAGIRMNGVGTRSESARRTGRGRYLDQVERSGDGYTIKLVSVEYKIDESSRDRPSVPVLGQRVSTCAEKVLTGKVDQSEQTILDDDQMGDGWVLVRGVPQAPSPCTGERPVPSFGDIFFSFR